MQKLNTLIALGLTALLFVACGSEDDEEVEGLKPTLSSIQSNIFNKSCTASSCHGDQAQGGLDLREGKSFAELVNVQAQKADMLLVKPGSPNESFLVTKIVGKPPSGQGDLMPLGGRPLSSDKIEAIKTWITDGAKK